MVFLPAVSAQNSSSLKRELAVRDGFGSGVVNVTEHGNAAEAVYRYGLEKNGNKSVKGYRIRIFFANNQTARQDAMYAREQFHQLFPGIPTYLGYEAPSFVVDVGNCMSVEEAYILLAMVSPHYRSAFLWRGDIPISEFLKGNTLIEIPQEETPEDSRSYEQQ